MTEEADQDGLWARMTGGADDAASRLLGELLDSPIAQRAIERAVEARELAAQAQVVAMSALNLPTAADVERLTRRVRSLSQRLESIEDALERIEARLSAQSKRPADTQPSSGPADSQP